MPFKRNVCLISCIHIIIYIYIKLDPSDNVLKTINVPNNHCDIISLMSM